MTNKDLKGKHLSVLSYAGGKARMMEHIIPLLPSNIKDMKFYDVFVGGGNVFLNLLDKNIIEKAYINDNNKELMSFYRMVTIYDTFYFKQQWIKLISHFNSFEEIKYTYNLICKNHLLSRLTDYLFINRLSYSGLQGRGISKLKWEKGYLKTPLKKWDKFYNLFMNVKNWENWDYKKYIKQNNSEIAFFFLDPPYYKIKNLYKNNNWGDDEFKEMKKILSKIKGYFMLTINDDPFIRELFKDYVINVVPVKYSIRNDKKVEKKTEIIITNYVKEKK